jgi:hypothetical protein
MANTSVILLKPYIKRLRLLCHIINLLFSLHFAGKQKFQAEKLQGGSFESFREATLTERRVS